MDRRFVFTVSTGRCGEASLSALINRHATNAYAAFEEPQVNPILPGALGDMERLFRRHLVETDELLGRGQVLRAHAAGDDAYIDRIVARRLSQIERLMARKGKSVYVDVSKFFARGLHAGYVRALPAFGLILLVRDPIENMRSYLNREKNFFKDNPPTDALRNLLRLDPGKLRGGELYLWAWCEMYLRFLALRETGHGAPAVVIHTGDLNDPNVLAGHFRQLGLEFASLSAIPALNTNVSIGRSASVVTEANVQTFTTFLAKLPPRVIDRIDYLRGYKPRAVA